MGDSAITIQFFDLEGLDGKRFSPFGWRVRMALAHKGLESTSIVEGVGFSEKYKLEFSYTLLGIISSKSLCSL